MMPAATPRPDTMLSHALAYARRGWSVFPLHSIRDGACSCKDGADCASPGKHPLTRHGLTEASADQATVSRWWMKWPDANIGLNCGASGLVAIDIDPRSQGDESLARFESEHQPLPPTLTALTGGGGQHYIYQLGDQQRLKSGNGWRLGIDVKADGGYVVVTPSNHASGRDYQWDAGAEDEPQPIPAWLSDALSDLAPKARKPAAPAADAAATRHGNGKTALYNLFDRLGWVLRTEGNKTHVRCPWENEHTGGHRGSRETSTTIFGGKIGDFFCQHDHCLKRRAMDIRKMFPDVWDLACDDAGLPRDRRPVTVAAEATGARDGAELALSLDKYGNPKPTAANVAAVLSEHPDWAGCLTWDVLRGAVYWARPVPVVAGVLKSPAPGRELCDSDLTYVSRWLALRCGIEASAAVVAEGVTTASHALEVDALRDYLQGVRWDGTPRLDGWLADHCGADRGEYSSAVGRWWMISAVARALDPGCQCDHVLILQGAQGARKSTALAVLGGEWYRAGLPSLRDDVRASMALRGVWIVGIDELSALGGSTSEASKEYLTRRWDRYRQPYARTETLAPRRVCFAATTNSQQYLDDPTGARRYWPVGVGACDAVGLAAVRDQLWAEAVELWGSGERYWPDATLDSAELTAQIREATEAREMTDPWDYYVDAAAEQERTKGGGISVRDILSLVGVQPDRMDRRMEMRVSGMLVRRGLVRRQTRKLGVRAWVYVWLGNT